MLDHAPVLVRDAAIGRRAVCDIIVVAREFGSRGIGDDDQPLLRARDAHLIFRPVLVTLEQSRTWETRGALKVYEDILQNTEAYLQDVKKTLVNVFFGHYVPPVMLST